MDHLKHNFLKHLYKMPRLPRLSVTILSSNAAIADSYCDPVPKTTLQKAMVESVSKLKVNFSE